MKTIVDSWHSGITGVRLAGQFADYAHLLLEDEVEDIDHLESVAEVVARATKDCKSPARNLQSLEVVDRG